MAEVYSSLYKGLVHITTPYSDKHKAIDLGNYKTKNKIYSPTKFGTGKVVKYTTSYTYNDVLYKNVATIWYSYPNGWVMCLVHGDTADQVVKVGDTVKVGQQIYVTGNKGYSKGDHLHCQLTKSGVYKDPANYILNDKAVPIINPPITPPTPPVTPEPTECEKQLQILQDSFDSLKADYTASQRQVDSLAAELVQAKVEQSELQQRYDTIYVERSRFENEKVEAIRQLNVIKNGRFMWVVDFLEKLFSKK